MGSLRVVVDSLAAAGLVELGGIIGARCAIKSKSRDPWLTIPNLWGGIVGLPSAEEITRHR
jgi:hypothetical protein